MFIQTSGSRFFHPISISTKTNIRYFHFAILHNQAVTTDNQVIIQDIDMNIVDTHSNAVNNHVRTISIGVVSVNNHCIIVDSQVIIHTIGMITGNLGVITEDCKTIFVKLLPIIQRTTAISAHILVVCFNCGSKIAAMRQNDSSSRDTKCK